MRLFLAVLGLRWYVGFLSCGEQGLLFVAGRELLIAVAPLDAGHRLQSADSVAVAYRIRCMWNLPGRRMEPTSPALAGGFLSTEPPGKSQENVLLWSFSLWKKMMDNLPKKSIGFDDPHILRWRLRSAPEVWTVSSLRNLSEDCGQSTVYRGLLMDRKLPSDVNLLKEKTSYHV